MKASCRLRISACSIAPGGNGKPLPCGAHRNLVIAGNQITDSAWPNVYVTSTVAKRTPDESTSRET